MQLNPTSKGIFLTTKEPNLRSRSSKKPESLLHHGPASQKSAYLVSKYEETYAELKQPVVKPHHNVVFNFPFHFPGICAVF